MEIIVRRITKEEAKDILAEDRANYKKKKENIGGVAATDNTVIPGGKSNNPTIK